jgi:hypothetical protein
MHLPFVPAKTAIQSLTTKRVCRFALTESVPAFAGLGPRLRRDQWLRAKRLSVKASPN